MTKHPPLTVASFITRANIVHHGKYSYDLIAPSQHLTRYASCIVTVVCPQHGPFNQRVTDHLRGRGCKQCSSKSSSNKALSWMDYLMLQSPGLHIQHANNTGEFFVRELSSFVDGYCALTNTVYEFDGDAFHGNPGKYSADQKCHPFNKDISAGDLLNSTLNRHQRIRDCGYTLVTIWESDFDALNIPVHQYPNINNSRVHTNYPELLRDMGLDVVGDYKGAKVHHELKCCRCGGVHVATPASKLWCKKRHPGIYGCPTCTSKDTAVTNKARSDYIGRLLALGYTVSDYVNARTKALLTCVHCGTQKFVVPSSIIQRNVPCCTTK